ncbi:conserved membrane hypothetical protein [Nitrospina gracilis 3/211]|uniref:Uncharacterized protein n=1 Tax=Nitrospina gracilis (strain 3/211) TaxID=1266370 RepID=M1YKC4_NITG3|nr:MULTISPECIES: bestrophin family ion channel [Nitrospina]MCF8722421.1 putative membrane protein [Nitrospina sp. Nb-3]CCQ90932.1 conserved membrane hypothetical protein [Nitrospina gracilis 3/211]
MITHSVIRPSWFIQISGGYVFFFALYGLAVYMAGRMFPKQMLGFPLTDIGIFGTAVVILLAFRSNTAYNRFWEARIAWGDLVNHSRNFGSQVVQYIRPPSANGARAEDTAPVHRELIYRHLAFVNALRLQLRGQNDWKDLDPFLDKEEITTLTQFANRATQLNHRQSARLRELHEAGWIAERAYVEGLMDTVKHFYIAQGVSERIKGTPFPNQYSFFTRVFVWVFVLILPFGLIQHLGWTSVPLYTVLATIYIIIEHLGCRTEDPFEGRIEDVPIHAICRTIEIDLRQQLGETEVPEPLRPENGVLL